MENVIQVPYEYLLAEPLVFVEICHLILEKTAVRSDQIHRTLHDACIAYIAEGNSNFALVESEANSEGNFRAAVVPSVE